MFKVKLLTFDLINTLVKVRISPAHQYAEVAKSLGVNISEADISRVYQSTWRQKKLDHPAYGAKHGMTNQEWWSDFVFRVFTAAGYNGDPALLSKVTEKLIDSFRCESRAWEIIPGVNKCLEDLKCAGFKLGIVSNSDGSTIPMLRTHGLSSFFDFIICTANTGLEKPNPEIFKRALNAGGVNASDAAHVGDELESDYRAPRKIGMTSFLFSTQRRFADKDIVDVDQKCIIYDLSELRNLLVLKQ